MSRTGRGGSGVREMSLARACGAGLRTDTAQGWGTAVKPQEGPPRTGSKSPRQRGPQGAPAASTASGRFQGSLNTEVE